MTDTPKPDGSGDKKPDGNQQQTTNDDPKQKLDALTADRDEAIKRRDNALSRAQAAEARLAELEAEAQKNLEAKASKDKEAFEQYKLNAEKRVKELEEKLSSEQNHTRTYVLKDQIRNAARNIISEDAFDTFWDVYGNDFDLNEERKPQVKSSPVSIENYLKEIVSKKKFFAADLRGKGSGERSSSSGENGSSITMSELEAMSPGERAKAIAANKELGMQLMKHRAGLK